jgi:iron(III) transport system permease protein
MAQQMVTRGPDPEMDVAPAAPHRPGSPPGGTRGRVLGLVLLLVVGTPCLVPIFYVVVNSFSESSLGQPFDPSLAPFERALSNPKTLSSIGNSFLLALRVPIGLCVAFAVAWLLVRVELPGRKFIMYTLWFTFFLPTLPMTLGWILLAHKDYGLLNDWLMKLPFIDEPLLNIQSIPGILWVHLTLSTIPIMTILLAPALQQVDASYEEASDMAGARTGVTLRRITLPLVAPAMMTAFVAALIKALEVFEVEQLLGTPAGIFVYSTRIYDLLRIIPPDYPQAMALSTLFLLILLVVGLVYQRMLSRAKGNATITGRSVRLLPRARQWWAWLLSGVLFLGLVVAVGLPFVVLLLGSFTRLFGFFFITQPWTTQHWTRVFQSNAFYEAAMNSLVIGIVVAGLGTVIFSALAVVLARSRLWSRSLVSLVTWLPWAIPGVLLGTAFLNVFLNTPILSGLLTTLVPLIVVLLIQAMPLGTHLMRSSIEQISVELEEASTMSGASALTTFRRVTIPVALPMVVSVFILTFMSAFRDISATVLLATPGTRTLPLLMFEYSVGSQLEAAAVIGVIMALFALIVTVVVLRLGARLSISG